MKTSFKSFIAEKAMNPSVYKDVMKRLEDDARIGFEFEFLVPEDAVGETQSEYLDSFGIDDLGEMQNYFNITRNDFRQIENAYDSWFEDNKKDWIDRNYSDYEDDSIEDKEDREQNARYVAERKFDSDNSRSTGNYSIDNWLEDVHNGKLQLLFSEFGIDPKFGWVDESRSEFRTKEGSGDALQYVADLLHKENSNTQKGDPIYNSYKSWGVVDDGSVKQDGMEGVEVVSPPMKPSLAIIQMKNMFRFMKNNDFETNDTCGLHINVSVPNMAQKLDPLKLMLFMGEKYILDVFERNGNEFAVPLYLKLLREVRDTGFMHKYPKKFIEAAHELLLKSGKYRTANLGKLIRNGYVEFRVAGGTDYHLKEKEITDAIGRFLTSIDLAMDPELERVEYIKKVSKLIDLLQKKAGRTDFEISQYSDESVRSVMAEFKRVLTSIDVRHLMYDQVRSLVDSLQGNSYRNKPDLIASMIKLAYRGAFRVGLKPNEKEIVAIKKYAKKLGVTTAEIKKSLAEMDKILSVTQDDWGEQYSQIKKDFKL